MSDDGIDSAADGVEQGKRLVALAYGYNQPMDGLRTRAFVLRSTDARGSALLLAAPLTSMPLLSPGR